MAGGTVWSRRLAARMRVLKGLVRDTRRSLRDVADALELDIRDVSSRVEEIGDASSRPASLVVLGASAAARARLLHCLLGRRLLPEPAPTHCRWLRIQYGSSTQVHLTLGNSEFELVEDLECNKAPWETLPLEDLIRQDSTDFSTMLEVELNIPILKDGLKIIVPPDIDGDENTITKLKQKHSELYEKRDVILKLFNPIYLYAIDRIGKNVFSDDISSDNVVCSRSEEDFWTMFNMYQSNISENSECVEKVRKEWKVRDGEDFVLNSENCLDLHQIKEINPNAQVLFALFADSRSGETVDLWYDATESTEEPYCVGELPESDQELVEGIRRHDDSPTSKRLPVRYGEDRLERLSEERVAFMNELLDQWELMFKPTPKHQTKSQWLIVDDTDMLRSSDPATPERHEGDRFVHTRAALLSSVVKFGGDCLQDYLLENSTKLSEIHVKIVQQLILSSFELARELQVVPKKIQYVAKQEKQLFETIYQNFSEGDKKSALVVMMQDVLQELRDEVNNMDWSIDELPCHLDTRYFTMSMSLNSLSRSGAPAGAGPGSEPSDGEEAASCDSCSFDDYDIIHSDSAQELTPVRELVSARPADRIPLASESALFSLQFASQCTTGDSVSVKQASLDVQRTVLSKLSRKISLKLVPFVDCLKQTYFGTLQRCLDALESTCRQELGGRPASEAMRELLSVTRQVDLEPCASFSTLRTLLEAARRLFHKLRLVGGDEDGPCCVISPVWRRRAALSCQQSLSATKLARLIASQILERLSLAHERYQAALTSLESALASRLHHTEDVKLAIRKKYAPTFARLCLESTSLCDLLMWGTPELGREIGRGQYGVVYAARGAWGKHEPVAVKSVLPADERHYRELAMEFFYTRSIPPHPRIVAVHGSIVQRRAAGAVGVLLVSERRERDLHAAVRAGLPYVDRMRIACDIVEGIRYLHSLGLVHRDIKMKNVLLDSHNRAALSDLGFCAAEALMTGSVVGTPVHMAPELLGGDYDAAIDVYAFGILFWYLCAGNVRLPAAFEAFQNKEQLWTKVKRGLRPERLSQFTDACWTLMEACWNPEPARRALLGDIQLQLEGILRDAQMHPAPCVPSGADSEDDLEMTLNSGYRTSIGFTPICLDALESTCRQELGGRPASEAMRELLSVTRQVDLEPCASFSTLRTLLEAARRLFHKLRLVGGAEDGPCCVISPVWRRRAALGCQQSLSATKLARLIATQILERLSLAHERYQAALTSLESALASRLHHTEDVKLAIRKKYAPTFARLCLESTSLCDLLMWGTPELGREIGRGQYGVVYAARGAWGKHEPVAVKSVLPADERHYRELAMEFFYTRSIPPHPRIVAVHGSIVQRRAAGAVGVLLVSERRERDLHAAVRAGLPYVDRMRIACDIVEGIRYLHSLGLVHRDIKMKNVLLDSHNRAALSDLGFCAAEALMTGSVVGTPVHMAPELLGGDYDAAIDVYAFGILFWYLCAGNVRLPAAFEAFQNKEQLWTKVKRGLRPERLSQFTDACWTLMETCWNPEPARRALLGDIQLQLEGILRDAQMHPAPCVPSGADSEDDLEMTLNSGYRTSIGFTPM